MHIDIHTRFITLLGDPLAQSFAARMQNRGYEAAGLDLVYFYTVTGPEHLGEIIQGLRHMPFAGFAVTTNPTKSKSWNTWTSWIPCVPKWVPATRW